MAELLEAFHYYDKDHSGSIDKDEIQDVFRCVGVYPSIYLSLSFDGDA